VPVTEELKEYYLEFVMEIIDGQSAEKLNMQKTRKR
jgi:hypothetical protein